MKYIDAEKLIAEIERRKKQDVTFRERSLLIDMENAIASLQQGQPSLPSNLDEAAVQAHIRMEESGEEMTFLNTFKAGVEWMAGQGVAYEDIVEMDDEKDYLFMESIGSMISLEDTFNPGDEVVVQIRKK